jgi:hypothetical protein
MLIIFYTQFLIIIFSYFFCKNSYNLQPTSVLVFHFYYKLTFSAKYHRIEHYSHESTFLYLNYWPFLIYITIIYSNIYIYNIWSLYNYHFYLLIFTTFSFLQIFSIVKSICLLLLLVILYFICIEISFVEWFVKIFIC